MRGRRLYIALLFLAVLCSVLCGQAQITKSDYFMKTSHFRNSLNPALQPERGYLVIPLLPGIGASTQTNTFVLDNFTFKGADGKRVTFMHQSISAEDFLSNLRSDNYINTDANIKLFGFGFFKNNGYWNFTLGVRSHVDANIPKPFFELLKRGFDQNRQSEYDLSDLSATGSSFIELGVSHSRAFRNDKLILGARLKYLGGLADFNLDARKLTIDAGPDYWLAKSRVTLLGSAPSVAPTYDEKGNLHGFSFGQFNIPGMGGGMDLGAEYDVKDLFPDLDGLKVSGAINDIGFIVWTKKNTISLQSTDTEVVVSPNDYEIYNRDGSSIFDVFEDALDDIKQAVNLQGDARRTRVSMLRVNMNLGAEYELIKHKLSFGALYSIRFGNYFNVSEFTFSANYHPCYWFSSSLTYSVNHSQFDNFGAALHFTPNKGINLFIASDYTTPHISSDLIPISSRAINFQLGISIPLNHR